MIKTILVLACVFAISSIVVAQETRAPEVFGGYSYMRLDGGGFPRDFNANGFEASVTPYVTKRFGLVGDFSAHFEHDSSTVFGTFQDIHQSEYQLLGGPQWKFANSSRFAPFVHALAGWERTKVNTRLTSGGTTFFDQTDNANDLAMAFGGGLDIRLSKRVSLRDSGGLQSQIYQRPNDRRHHIQRPNPSQFPHLGRTRIPVKLAVNL